MSYKLIIGIVVIVSLYFFLKKSKSKKENYSKHSEPINSICPISGKNVKKNIYVKVGFCCKSCIKNLKDNLPEVLANVKIHNKNGKIVNKKCPLTDSDIDINIVKKIAFSSNVSKNNFLRGKFSAYYNRYLSKN